MRYKVRQYREKAKLTQEQLAEKSGVSRATISSLENGTAKTTNTDTLVKLANALGTKVSKLLFE